MAFLSFDEKAWDKVRPASVKKTGVSEALRAVEKLVPKKADDLDKPSVCAAAVEALDALEDKLQTARKRFDPKKHEDAVKKVTGWVSEIGVRRKLLTNRADGLSEGYDEAITCANAEIDPYFERAEEIKSSAQDIHSQLLDLAKQAMLAGARGDTQALQQCRLSAEERKKAFHQLKQKAQPLHANAVKAAMARLPDLKELNTAQDRKYQTMVTRTNALKLKVTDLEDVEEKIVKALEMLGQAGGKGDEVQAQFAKLIHSDIAAMELKAMEVGATETGIAVDLDQTRGRLDDAVKEGVDPLIRQQYLVQAGKWLKDAIGKLKRLDKQIAELAKTYQSKVDGYPDFVSPENPRFTKLLKSLDGMQAFLDSKRNESQPKLTLKTKQLGVRLQELLAPPKN